MNELKDDIRRCMKQLLLMDPTPFLSCGEVIMTWLVEELVAEDVLDPDVLSDDSHEAWDAAFEAAEWYEARS
jgi:hypothetical protein